MDVKELIARIRALQRYDSYTDYGCCEMCTPTASMEPDNTGDWVNVDDLECILKEFENG